MLSYTEYPLLSFISELNEQLSALSLDKAILDSFKKISINLGKRLLPALVKLGIDCMVPATIGKPAQEWIENIKNIAGDQIKDAIESYTEEQQTLKAFKDALRKITNKKTLFIFIDELDRCKPTFAIAILEIVKHIVDVENVCCILSINIPAISKSISVIYGHDTDEAKDYLERFIDISLYLPAPDLKKFVQIKFENISTFIKNKEHKCFFQEIINTCCDHIRSLRTIEKYFTDIEIFLAYNQAASASDQVPEIYYPNISVALAERRINSVSTYNSLSSDLNKNKKYTMIDDFFVNSRSEEKLIGIARKLYEQIIDLRNKSTCTSEEKSCVKLLQSIENSILGDLYNCDPDFVTFKKYINHYENAEQIINLLNLPTIESGKIKAAVG